MRLVIDITEEEYEEILSSEDCGLHTLTRAVANGTQLPKGHGRLIDADALELPSEEMISRLVIQLAPTIIEADGGD